MKKTVAITTANPTRLSTMAPPPQKVFEAADFEEYHRAEFLGSVCAQALARKGEHAAARPRRFRSGFALAVLGGLLSRFAGHAELRGDGVSQFVVFFDCSAGVLSTLGDVLSAESIVGAALLDGVGLDGAVEQIAFGIDALAVADVELGLPKGRGELVLHDFDSRTIAEDLIALLDGTDAADVEAHGGVVPLRPRPPQSR